LALFFEVEKVVEATLMLSMPHLRVDAFRWGIGIPVFRGIGQGIEAGGPTAEHQRALDLVVLGGDGPDALVDAYVGFAHFSALLKAVSWCPIIIYLGHRFVKRCHGLTSIKSLFGPLLLAYQKEVAAPFSEPPRRYGEPVGAIWHRFLL
jgi:hypothetical protein